MQNLETTSAETASSNSVMTLRPPDTILSQIEELNELVTKHPYNIPMKALAKFLHMDVDVLRHAAMHGGTPFDIHWNNGSNEVKVPSLAFYMFFMGKVFGGDFILSRFHSAKNMQ